MAHFALQFNNLLQGGAGRDLADFSANTTATTVDLSTGTAVNPDSGTDALLEIEDVSGGSAGDVLTGDANANQLFGNAGDDTLNGGLGNDSLRGGAGNDAFVGGEGIDTALYDDVSGPLTIDLAAGTTVGSTGSNAGSDTLLGIENVIASGASDQITGSAGDNLIDGAGGADVINAGAGNDVVVFDANDATVVGGAGVDTLSIGTGLSLLDLTVARDEVFTQFEVIDISATGSQVIKFSDADIRALNGDGTGPTGGTILINGTNEDSIRLVGANWPTTPTGTETIGGLTYNVYAYSVAGGVTTVKVQQGVAVGFIFRSGEAGELTVGTAGSDEYLGNGGNDTFMAGAGDDIGDGGTGNDSMVGGTGSDTLLGNTGNDTIYGGDTTSELNSGADSIDAGAGDDSVIAGDGDDTVLGGTGQDTISAGVGNDSIDAGDGNDSVSAGAGNDTLYGGAGNDYLDAGQGADLVDAGTGDDTVIGGSGNDTLIGGGGVDTLVYQAETNGVAINFETGVATGVGSGTDSFSQFENVLGGSGNDTIVGSGSANYVDGGSGADNIQTGLGNDTVLFDGTDTVDAGDGQDTLLIASLANLNLSTLAGTKLNGIEEIDLTGNGVQNIRLDAPAVVAFSNSTDTLKVHGDTGDLLNLVGNWTLAGTQPVSYAGGASESYLKYTLLDPISGQTATLLIDPVIELAIEFTGGSGNDVVSGGDGNDTVSGLGGNDTLSGGLGLDALLGGDGNDLIYYDANDILIDGGPGNDTVALTSDANDFVMDLTAIARPTVGGVRPEIVSIENIDITGRTSPSAGNNTLILNPSSAIALVGATGTLTITGNAGDKVYLTNYTEQTPDNLAGYTTWLYTSDTNQTLTLKIADAVEVQAAIVGTINNDTLTGDGNPNLVIGLTGDDTIDGGAGSDVLRADAGNDVLLYDAADLLIDGGSDNDTLIVDTESTLNLTAIDNAVISSISTIDLVAASNNVVFTANADDILALNEGHPVNILGGSGDAVALKGNWAMGTVSGGFTPFTLTNSDGVVVTVSIANAIPVTITYTGADTSVRDEMISGAGNQTLDAQRGNDSLDGGAGNDTLLGGAGDDVLVYDAADGAVSGGAGVDTLQLKGSGGTIDLTTVANSVITGIERIDITGTGDNTVVMNPDDVQALSTDSDTIIVQGDLGDSVRLAGLGWESRGSELVAGVTYNKFIGYATDGTAVTVLAGLRVDKGDQLMGTSGNDSLLGGPGSDLVDGLGGDDTLSGGGGADLVFGGDGNDTLIYDPADVLLDGGNGNDTLLVSNAGNIIDLQESGRPTTGALRPTLRSLETLNITGTGNNYVILDAATATALGGAGLTISGNAGDMVFVDGDPAAQTFTVTGASVRQVITNDGDATSPSDSLTGTVGQDAIKSGVGNDTIDAGTGADIVYAGVGDDVVVYDVNDLRVFGGLGTDTLIIKDVDSADGGSVNTNNRTNTSNGDVDLTTAGLSLLDGFEIIDLRGNGNQTVRLDEASVLAMSDTSRMVVKGDLNDVLKLYGNWATTGIESDLDGKIYTIYQKNSATVSVAQEVTVAITNELGGSVIMGTSGTDDTTISSFADGASAGDGDDIIRVANMSFVGVDGGRGYDKVYFELNANSTINTALLSSTALTGIEEIDLRQDSTTTTDDAYISTLILTPEKVMEMSGATGVLVVTGSSKDTINLYGVWGDVANAPIVVYNGATYFELIADNGAKLYYSPQISVTKIDPTLQMSAFSVAYDAGAYLVSSGIEQYAGWKVANAGDINKDGIEDLIINKIDGGYVVFGTDSMVGQFDLSNLGTRGFQITGNGVILSDLTDTGYQNANWNQYNFGLTPIGDVNGDGIADIATTNGSPNSLTVIYGRTEWSNINLTSFVASSSNGFTMTFTGFPDEKYTSIAGVGDVNNDGYADFAVGNSFANSGMGAVYLVFGGAHTNSIDATAAQTNRWIVIGSDAANKTNIGVDISGLGDINGDGLDDFVIGGPAYFNTVTTGTSSQTDYSGSAYIIYGKADAWANSTVVQRDYVAPVLTSLSPSDDVSAVAVNSNLQLNFNESVILGSSGYIGLYRAGTDVLVERFDVATGVGNLGGKIWATGQAVYFNPVNPLSSNVAYYVKADAGSVKDLSGNAFAGIANSSTWNFTSAANTDLAGPNLRAAYLEAFSASNASNDAQPALYNTSWTTPSNQGDVSMLFGTLTSSDISIPYAFDASDVRPSSAVDYSSSNSSVNYYNESDFKLYFAFDKAVRPYGQIVIKQGGNVVESFDLQTGLGSLGGGLKPLNLTESRPDIYTTSAGKTSVDSTGFVIDPGFTLARNTTYTVELLSIKDGSGNNLSSGTSFEFTTNNIADTVAPVILAWNMGSLSTAFTNDTSATNNAINVSVQSDIVFKASESLIPGTTGSVDIKLYDSYSSAAVETFAWTTAPTATSGVYTLAGSLGGTLTISGQTVKINPGQNLAYNTKYSLSATGLTDPNGVAFSISANTDHYFTTVSQTTTVQTLSGNAVQNLKTVGLNDNIVLRFDESVMAGTSTAESQYIKLYNTSGTLIESFDVATGLGYRGATLSGGTLTFQGAELTLNPGGSLDYATGYYLTVTAQAIRAANESVTEDVGNVDGNTVSTRYYTAANMTGSSSPLYFTTEAGTQIDPGWMATPSISADTVMADTNYLAGGWSSYVSTLPGNINVGGLKPGEWTGMEVSAAGDVDGDGAMDFIIGSPMKVYDPTLNPADAGDNYVYGKYYLVFGQAGSTSVPLNISDLAAEGRVVKIYGPSSNWLKGVVEFGDLNKDGYADLLITAGGNTPDSDLTNTDKLASNDGDTDAGSAFVVFGQARAAWLPSINITQLGKQGLEITGGLPQEQLGFSAAAGDFNGDGIVDMVFGMPRNDRDGFASGEGFVINGGDFTNTLMSVGTDQADTLIGFFGEDRLAGQQGNDQIFGLGGADILRGGQGNDVIGLTDLDFTLLDGGTGIDTLKFVGHGFDLDMTGYAGASLRSFETIDMTGDGDNAITMNYREVVYLLERELSTSYGTQTQLTIDGNVGDKVTLEGPWALINSDNTYNYYALDGIFVAVDADITQVSPGWTIPYRGATIDFNAPLLPDGLRIDVVDFSVTANTQPSTGFLEPLGDVNNDGFADFAVADNAVSTLYLPYIYRTYGFGNDDFVDEGTPTVPYVAGLNLYTSSAGIYHYRNDNYNVGTTGVVYVVYGQAGGLGSTDFNLLGSGSQTDVIKLVSGAQGADRFAESLGSLGDINGDGLPDFVIGATNTARSYVFTEGGEIIWNDLTGSLGTDVGPNSSWMGAQYNFDSTVGSSPWSPNYTSDSWAYDISGRQYFFLGGNATLVNQVSGAITNTTVSNNAQGIQGTSTALPITTDGGSDAWTDLPDNAGTSGSKTTYTFTTNSTGASLTTPGTTGWSPISLGDLNGDGYGDFMDSASNGLVYFGQPLSSGIDQSINWTILDLGSFTRASAAGDLNGDGFDDIVLGYGNFSYVVFGQAGVWTAAPTFNTTVGANGTTAASGGTPGIVRIDAETGYTGQQGLYTRLGDINGDGYEDILVAGNSADNYNAKSNGAAYVIFGAANVVGASNDVWDANIDMGTLAANGRGFRVVGATDGDLLSSTSWTGVGDVNGDGYDDFIIQSSGEQEGAAANNATAGSGSSYLFLGQGAAAWRNIDTLEVQDYGIQVLGTGLGEWMALGDVDGDGFDDMALVTSTGAQIFYGSNALSSFQDSTWTSLGNGSSSVQTIAGTSGATLTAQRGSSTVALLGQDRLVGNAGNDTLISDGGVDVLNGGAGNDLIKIVDNKFFQIDGGTGIDTLELLGSMTLDLTTVGNTRIVNMEVVKLGTGDQTLTLSASDVLKMTGQSNTLVANSAYQTGNVLVVDSTSGTDALVLNGADWLTTGVTTSVANSTGTFTVYQANGANIFVVTDLTPTIGTSSGNFIGDANAEVIYGGVGADVITANAGNDTVYGSSGADSIEGNDGSDSLVGGLGNDTLKGGLGDDTIVAGNGDDSINGDAGNDLLDYRTISNEGLSIVYTGVGAGTVSGSVIGTDTFASIETVFGSERADTITGSNGNDTLTWHAGGSGNDSFVGGAGNDTLDYTGLDSAAVITFTGAGTGTVRTANYGTDNFSGFETVVGSGSNDVFINASDSTVIQGGAGVDTLDYSGSANAVTVLFTADAIGSVSGGAVASFTAVESIIGSSGDDSLTGSAGTQYFFGGLGNDTIDGGADSDKLDYTGVLANITVNFATSTVTGTTVGTDTFSNIEIIAGGSGNDAATGSLGADSFEGGDGNDTLTGGAGNDTFVGGNGNDQLDLSDATNNLTFQSDTVWFGYNGYVTVTGSTGTDSYYSIEGIKLGAGNDSILGFSGTGWVDAGGGNDSVVASNGNDTLMGGSGNDTLVGNDGNDWFVGGSGNDSINAGNGADVLDYSIVTGDLNVDLSTGAVSSDGQGGVDTIVTGFMEAVLGGSGNDSIVGGTIDETLIGGAGDDTLSGGAGNDTLAYTLSTADLTINLTTGVASGAGTDTVSNFENVVGGMGNDAITGDAGNNVLYGSDGNDTLAGSTGNDSLWGGDGNDVFVLTDDAGDDWIYGGNGFDIIDLSSITIDIRDRIGSAGYFDGYNRDQWIYFLTDVAASQSVDNGGGSTYPSLNDKNDDWFTDIEGYILGSGNDYTRVQGSGQNATTGHPDARDGYLDGGAGSDTLLGWEGNETIIGGSGADSIVSGNGNDVLIGNAGNDTLNGEGGFDWVNYSATNFFGQSIGATGAITVDMSLATNQVTNDGDGGVDYLIGIEGLVGSAFADSIKGSTGNESLTGGLGNDTLDGNTGVDTLDFSRQNTAVSIDLTLGTATSAADNVDTLSNFEIYLGGLGDDTIVAGAVTLNETMSGGAGNDSLIGGAGNDSLIGGAGNDTLLGGADNDTLSGGLGHDSLDGGAGTADVLDLTSATARMSVNLAAGTGSGEGTDTYAGFEIVWGGSGADTFVGSTGNDSLLGNAGFDSISAGLGSDTVEGGAGNDWIDGGDGIDSLTGGNESDTLLGSAGDDILKGGEGNDSLDGGADNDSLFGENGEDTLQGGVGDDTLDGGAGNDVLLGGDGNDVFTQSTNSDSMLGGAGNDVFNVAALTNNASYELDINGGTGVDTVSLNSGGAYDFRAMTQMRLAEVEILRMTQANQTVTLDNANVRTYAAVGNAAVDNATYGASSTKAVLVVDATSLSSNRLMLIGEGWHATSATTTILGGTTVYAIYTFRDENISIATNSVTVLVDGAGFDSMIGTAGADSLDGGAGDDSIIAGDGNDTVSGGLGNDLMQGGDGVDLLTFAGTTSNLHLDLSVTTAQDTGLGIDTFSGFEIVQGGSGADTLQGGAANDTMLGGAGADVLNGGAGEDSLTGEAGRDLLDGGDANDMLIGGDDADTLQGGAGIDTMYGDNGADALMGGDGADAMLGGADNDTLQGEAGNDSIQGNDGNDQLQGGDGLDTLDGGNGNDLLWGGADADNVSGAAGDDLILGEAGNDTLTAGSGNDTVSGGDGNDSIDGTSGNNLLQGGADNDTITGGSDSDTISGGVGNDSLNGAGGADVLDMSASTTAMSLDLSAGWPSTITDTAQGTDTISGFEGVIGGSGSDSLTGSSSADILGGGFGNDTLIGGAGLDTLDYSFATLSLSVDLSQNRINAISVGDGQGGVDRIIGFENVSGSTASDWLQGTLDANVILGFQGNDILLGLDGHDSLDGGFGNDSLEGGNGNDTILGADGNDTLLGGDGNDSLTGGAGNDSITAGLGQDTLTGGDGDDTFIGNSDAYQDWFNGDNGFDLISYKDVTIDINTNTGNYFHAQYNSNYYFIVNGQAQYNNAIEGLIGGQGNDYLSNQGGYAVYFDGYLGNDTLVGNNGNDTLYGDQGDDSIDGANGNDYMTGGTGADSLWGSNGNDTILGEAGNDVIGGVAGDDYLDGGDGMDALVLFGITAAITLDLSTSWQGAVAFSGLGIDTIRNFEGVIGGDGAYNDSITGSAGNDIIGGGSGTDTLSGGAGIDTLSFAWANTGANVNLATGTMTNDGYNYVDVFSGFENVDGGRGTDSIVGSAVSNVIRGDAGNDTIIGSAGNDTLDGGTGTDLLSYSSQTLGMNMNLVTGQVTDSSGRLDIISNFESIQAGTGDDTITTTAFAETVRGGSGNDVFVTELDSNNSDLFDGEAGFDVLRYTAVTNDLRITNFVASSATQYDLAYTVNGTTYYDYYTNLEGLAGGSGNDLLQTTNLADVYFEGGSGHDSLLGAAGNDTLLGGDGDDMLSGGAGNDVLDGGDGIDVLDLSGTSDVLTLSLTGNWQGTITKTLLGTDTVSNFEGVIGGAGNDSITGSTGNDVIGGGAGNDTLAGGDGTDTLSFDASASNVTVNLQTNTSTGEGTDVISGFENISAGSGADNLTGSSLDNVIRGNVGNDTITGSAGNDTLEGNAGTDTLTYAGYTAALVMSLTNSTVSATGKLDVISGFEQLIGGEGDDTIVGAANNDTLQGGNGNDSLAGALGNDSLYGNAGNDTLEAGTGQDIVYGGDGNDLMIASVDGLQDQYYGENGFDILSYTNELRDINFGTFYSTNGNGNNFNLFGEAEYYYYVEGLIGGQGNDSVVGANNWAAYIDGYSGNDTLIASGGIDTLLGGSGNDSIDGGGGNDIIAGGTGNDTLLGNSGTDLLDMSAATSNLTINLTNIAAGNVTLVDAALGTDVVNGFESILLGAGTDSVLGSSSDNLISGGAGNDTLDGGAGNDTLSFVNATADVTFDLSTNVGVTTTVRDGQGGTDTVSNFENVEGGVGNDSLTGSTGANLIIGGAGQDTLIGGLGSDTLWGGDGNDLLIGSTDTAADYFYGDAGFDLISYQNVTIDINTNTGNNFYAQYNSNYYFTVNGQAQYNNAIEGLIGGQGNDYLASQGANGVYFDGYLGNDSILGNSGNDTLLGGSGNDSITGNAGSDSMDGGLGNDTLVAGDAEDTVYAGAGDDSLDGGNGNDSLWGEAGDDSFVGGAGNDTLRGGDGQDTLLGDAGDDSLLGGAGYDVLAGGAGNDVIDGGDGVDVLDLSSTTDAITLDLSTAWQGAITPTSLGTDTVSNMEGVIGGSGNDSITGTAGNDVIGGYSGNDTLIGGEGVDTLSFDRTSANLVVNLQASTVTGEGTDAISGFENVSAGSGADSITGSSVDNWLRGNLGSDTLVGSAGNDTLEGGQGVDRLVYTSYASSLSIDLVAGTVTGFDSKADVVSGFESVYGGEGNDTILDGDSSDSIWGGNGNDNISGNAGNDSLLGEAGNDTLDGGLGQDTLYGGAGDDVFMGVADTLADYYYGDAGFDVIDYRNTTVALDTSTSFQTNNTSLLSFTFNGVLQYFQNMEGLMGGQGNDILKNNNTNAVYFDGFSGNDSITGNTGADTLMGGAGDDTLSGGTGNDSIDGGAGNDRISFQTNETVSGGSGVDTLWFASTTTTDFNTLATFNGSNIEALDLLGTGVNVNLTLSHTLVSTLAGTSNAGIGDSTYAAKQVLVINGNAGDALTLTGGQWADTGVDTSFNASGSFSIYQFGTSDIYVATNLVPSVPSGG